MTTTLMPLSTRFVNLRNDLMTDDYSGMATISDIEWVACECIVRNRRTEGCELLSAFIRLTVNAKSKHVENYLREVLMRLEEAARVLA